MATITARPTTIISYSSESAQQIAQGFTDGDTDKQVNVDSDSTATYCIVGGFDFSALPAGAIVTNIQVYVKMYASRSGTTKIFCVTGADSSGGYTDLGDGGIVVSQNTTMSSSKYVSGSFANAATAMSAEKLRNNQLQVRFHRTTVSGVTRSYDLYVQVTYTETFSITGVASPTAGGAVTGGGYFQSGQTAMLTATPNTGYKFKQWSDGNTSNPRTVTVSANATYTAQFEKLTYTVSVSASPTTGGTVSGGGTYIHGSTATLTATPNTGYKFAKWSDGNTNASRSVTVTSALSLTAQFELISVTISASVDPPEGGAVLGTGSYKYGDSYTLTAVPNDGYKFVRWSTWQTTPSITRTASLSDEEFTAYFEKEETSNIFIGTKRVSVYCGTKKVSVYCGTKKLS